MNCSIELVIGHSGGRSGGQCPHTLLMNGACGQVVNRMGSSFGHENRLCLTLNLVANISRKSMYSHHAVFSSGIELSMWVCDMAGGCLSVWKLVAFLVSLKYVWTTGCMLQGEGLSAGGEIV